MLQSLLVYGALLLASQGSMTSGQKPDPPTHPPFERLDAPEFWIMDNAYLQTKYIYTDLGTGDSGTNQFGFYCANYCQGEKHFEHKACDASCDRACEEIHEVTMEPEFRQALGFYDGLEAMRAGANRFGVGEPEKTDVEFERSYDAVLYALVQQKLADDKFKIKAKTRHFNSKPCSGQFEDAQPRNYNVTLQWQYVRKTEVNGQIVITKGPSGEIPLLKISVPQAQRLRREVVVSCRCAVVTVPEDKKVGALQFNFGEGHACVPTNQHQQYGMTVACENMNEAIFSCASLPAGATQVSLQAGTTLISQDPKVQNMMAVTTANIDTLEAYVSTLGQPGMASVKFRVSCLNMNLKEPSPNTKFKIGPPAAIGLVRLAQLFESERLRGPVGQARIWIYTDKATHEQIADRLLPAPTKGSYVKALWDVALVGGVDFSREEYKKLISPELLPSTQVYAESTEWFVNQLDELCPDKTAKWIESNVKAFGPCYDSKDKYGREYVANLARNLCKARSESMRAAGLKLLMAVPKEQRAEVGRLGGLAGISYAFMVGQKTSDSMIDVIEAYGPDAARLGVLNPHANVPASQKSRLSKLAASLSSK